MTNKPQRTQSPLTCINKDSMHQHYLKRCWQYRELFFCLARRDVLVRYRQTAVGILWLLFRPALTIFVFTILFGVIAQLPTGDLPYLAIVVCGAIPWQCVNSLVSQAAISLINNHSLLTKVQFPRIVLPFSTVIPNLLDIFISYILIIGLLWILGVPPSITAFLAPFCLIPLFLVSAAVGTLFAAYLVRWRDLNNILPLFLQAWMLLSPVGFLMAHVPDTYRIYAWLNPLAAPLASFRWCLLPGMNGAPIWAILYSLLISSALFFLSYFLFRRAEREFADII